MGHLLMVLLISKLGISQEIVSSLTSKKRIMKFFPNSRYVKHFIRSLYLPSVVITYGIRLLHLNARLADSPMKDLMQLKCDILKLSESSSPQIFTGQRFSSPLIISDFLYSLYRFLSHYIHFFLWVWNLHLTSFLKDIHQFTVLPASRPILINIMVFLLYGQSTFMVFFITSLIFSSIPLISYIDKNKTMRSVSGK